MRHKLKKEAADTIAWKIANDGSGKILGDLLELSKAMNNVEVMRENQKTSIQDLLNRMEWMNGYQEEEIPEFMRSLKEIFEKMAFNQESSYVKTLTSIVAVGILSSYGHVLTNFEEDSEIERWEKLFEETDNKKISVCFEIFKHHCPLEITIKDFLQARQYIKIWDSEYNW